MDHEQYPTAYSMLASYPNSASLDPLLDGMVDPELDFLTSSYSKEPWSLQYMAARCAVDHDKFSNLYHHRLDAMSGFHSIRQADGVTALPSSLIPRSGSPSDNPSSTCSSSLSPVAENDYGFTPSTPLEEASMSPYSGSLEWSAQSCQTIQFTGPSNVCLTHGDMNVCEEMFSSCMGERNPEFSLRGLSMSSHGSSYESNAQAEQLHLARHMSPSELSTDIQEEIRVPDTTRSSLYPAPESDDEDHASDEEIELPNSSCQDDEDDEYKPSTSQRRRSSNVGRSSRSRKRSITTHPARPVKKSKCEPIASAGSRQTKTSALGITSSFPCPECRDIAFKDEASLQKHIKQQHTRPFICVFNFAGCESTFASKNEWKRHVSSQHLLLNYWICQEDSCSDSPDSVAVTKKPASTSHNRSGSVQDQIYCVAALLNGSIFNRKDLYTQHVKRMHVPPNFKRQVKQKKTVPQWEDRIRQLQEQAFKTRCELPSHLECPAQDCNVPPFQGSNAWDDRMEHVAKHLEKAATGIENPIFFGGPNDPTLIDWASRPDVAVVVANGKGGWRLNNPLKPDAQSRRQASTAINDEDADGEEVDE